MQTGRLESQLNKYLFDQKGWVSKASMFQIEWKNKRNGTHYTPETVGRALRSLESKSYIAVKHEGKNTKYKWIPHEMRKGYIPTSFRAKGKEMVLFR